MGKERDTLETSLTVLQGMKFLTPADLGDPDNKQYYKHCCLSANIHNGHSFYKIAFNVCICCFQATS